MCSSDLDAGHFSPSDLVGLTDDFMAGCGQAQRQEGGADFTYLDPAEGKSRTYSLATAFFDRYLLDNAEAEAWLKDPVGMVIEAR